jgi:hypothetical protein
MPTLELIGGLGLTMTQKFQRVHTKTKPKHRRTALVGHTEGTLAYGLVYPMLSNRGEDTPFSQVFAFYRAREADGQAFDVPNLLEGGTLSMRFAVSRLTAEMFARQLLSVSGVELVLDRPATFTIA